MKNFKLVNIAKILLIVGFYQEIWGIDQESMHDLDRSCGIPCGIDLLSMIEEPRIPLSAKDLSSVFAGVVAAASKEPVSDPKELDGIVVYYKNNDFSDEESDGDERNDNPLKIIQRKAIEGDPKYQALLKGLTGKKYFLKRFS